MNCFKALFAAAICLLCFNINAKKSYLTIGAGYGLKSSTQNLPDLYMYNFVNDETGFTTREQINLSLGKGFTAEGSFGYMFLKNVGAELTLSCLAGAKTDSRFTYTSGKIDYSLSARMVRLVPAVVLKGNGEKVIPYGKFGLVTGYGSVTLDEQSNLPETTNEFKSTRFNKGLAVGLTAGIGLITSISKSLSLVTELNMVNQSYAPLQSEVTKYTVNGINSLDLLTVSEKQAEFYDSVRLKVIEPDQPRPVLRQKLPFGSVGLKIGLQINL